jgi:hypothetical protein
LRTGRDFMRAPVGKGSEAKTGLTSFLLHRTQFAEIAASRVRSLIRNGWGSQIFEVGEDPRTSR